MYSRTCLIHWRAYLFQIIRCCSAEWINFHHRSPFIVTNLTSIISATMLELIQDQGQSSPTASNQHKPEKHDNQPHASHCPKDATTNNNPNLPPSHNRCKPPWHTTIQPSSRTRFILHRSVHSFHYTHCSTGPMEAAWSFIKWHGVRSMLIDLRLTTSYQSPAMKMAHILHPL